MEPQSHAYRLWVQLHDKIGHMLVRGNCIAPVRCFACTADISAGDAAYIFDDDIIICVSCQCYRESFPGDGDLIILEYPAQLAIARAQDTRILVRESIRQNLTPRRYKHSYIFCRQCLGVHYGIFNHELFPLCMGCSDRIRAIANEIISRMLLAEQIAIHRDVKHAVKHAYIGLYGY